MMAKSIVWFAVVALAAVWSATALPLDIDDAQPVFTVEKLDVPAPSMVNQKQDFAQQTEGTDAPVLNTEDGIKSVPEKAGETEVTETPKLQNKLEFTNEPAEETVPDQFVPSTSITSDIPAAHSPSTVSVGTNTPTSFTEINSPSPVTGTDSPSFDTKPQPSAPIQVSPSTKPQHMGGEQTVKLGPNIPFFLDFFQPFQPYQTFQPFQPFQPFAPNHEKQPFRHQPIPFGAPINPFANPIHTQPFNQLVDAYTNEFRNMLTSLNKMSMSQMDNLGDVQEGSDMPVKKTSSKTEIIDGHKVQINETTVSNGNGNSKSFYHFKEIHILPEETNEKFSNEKLTSEVNVDSDTQKIELNEFKPDPSETVVNTPEAVSLEDHFQAAAANIYAPYAPQYGSPHSWYSSLWKNHGPMYRNPNVQFNPETAINWLNEIRNNDLAKPLPSGGSGKLPARPPTRNPASKTEVYGSRGDILVNDLTGSRPSDGSPETVISLHDDIRVNKLAEERQRLSGVASTLPVDVETVDVNGKIRQGTQYDRYTIDNQLHGGGGKDKFGGRKDY